MGILNLSWVITTRNKLVFLKEVLSRLTSNLQEDEEIIVIDGASTDGTKEYLAELKRQGLIHKFLSERDHGEAEGYNKGLLLANGTLIKIITDDDAFYLPGIRRCKEYMLSNPEIDFMSTDGAAIDFTISNIFTNSSHTHSTAYQQWVKTAKPFAFCGLGIMLRKQSLPLLGLFHTGVIRVDSEYTLRVTSSKARIAWYTGCTWIHIPNIQSNVFVYGSQIAFEGEKLYQFYIGEYSKPLSDLQILDLAKRGIGTTHYEAQQADKNMPALLSKENASRIFQQCDAWFENLNKINDGLFFKK